MEENKIKNFWDLKAWQVGNKLCLEIYLITKNFRTMKGLALFHNYGAPQYPLALI